MGDSIRKAIQLQAVRDAYWANSGADDGEFSAIADALNEFCGVQDATIAHKKQVFDMLPASMIGSGISWGFDDTEVRDNIYGFVRENAEKMIVALAQTKP